MLAVAEPADLDNGPRTTKSATERMCVATRRVRPISELIRFVMSPDGDVVPDLKRKLPGRGLWVTATQAAVTDAVKRNLFARGFKRNLKARPDLASETDRLLLRGVLDALAIAAKAGEVVSGFGKVADALGRSEAVALLHASDGALDGIRKLDALARQNAPSGPGSAPFPIIAVLSSAELDLALGRSNVIHAALLPGTAGKTFLSRCHGLVQYRMAESDKTDHKRLMTVAATSDPTVATDIRADEANRG